MRYPAADRKPALRLSPHGFPGKLIVFEGIDGSGKSTLLRECLAFVEAIGVRGREIKLIEPNLWRLQGFDAFMRDPAGAVGGNVSVIGIAVACTGFRIESMRSKVYPELATGTWVFCDRYVYTTVAEFLVSNGSESDYRALTAVVQLLPRPDLAFLASAPIEVCLERVRERREESDYVLDAGYFERLHQSIHEIAQHNAMQVVRTDVPLAESVAGVKRCLHRLAAGSA